MSPRASSSTPSDPDVPETSDPDVPETPDPDTVPDPLVFDDLKSDEPTAVDVHGNVVDPSEFTHPMTETGAVTEDKPVGAFIDGQAKFPAEPTFGICQGDLADLELLRDQADNDPKVKVRVTSSFTGKTLTEDPR